jgi:predicted nucleic acid-binding protein
VSNLLVYLDNCCYNRPFDDQTQLRISLEAQAKLYVQSLIRDGKIDLAWSYVSFSENFKNPFLNRRFSIDIFSKYAKKTIIETDIIIQEAKEIGKKLKPTDSLHVACAIHGKVDFLITTDDGMLRYETNKIRIVDPVAFVRFYETRSKA